MASEVGSIIGAAGAVVGAIVPEAAPAIELFGLLEPEVQKILAGLITKIHRKQLTAQDYLDQAQTLINARTATPDPAPPVAATATPTT
jgi:hypothetical protein